MNDTPHDANSLAQNDTRAGGSAELVMERELIQTLKTDKRAGLEALARAHYKKAYALALGMVGNRDDALDVTQEAFIRVQRSIHTFDESKSFFPWFYTILANLCKTALSKRGRRAEREADFDYHELTLAHPGASPEAEALQREQLLQLRSALGALSFTDREIINLKHFQDFSYDEIARALDIPRGTVMSRLYYARRRLAEQLQLFEDDNESTKGAQS
ncbi:MAG TPA: RNA polymerase sigma factor [candidate division Zixibacteria bacterium]|nr:RNA polymerase sigma factor [candidate division Zixibacteria bacterium]